MMIFLIACSFWLVTRVTCSTVGRAEFLNAFREKTFDVIVNKPDIITEKYTLNMGDSLGDGFASKVYQASRLADDDDDEWQELVAVKQVDEKKLRACKMTVETEVRLLSSVTHPNIPKLLDVFASSLPDPETVYLVFPLYRRGSLARHCQLIYGDQDDDKEKTGGGNEKLDQVIIKRVMRGVLQAIIYLHANGLVHRDIKPANIMISDEEEGILIDYGYAIVPLKDDPAAMTRRCGTLLFTAPEVFCCHAYNHLVDIWSFGVTLWSMHANPYPECGTDPHAIMRKFMEHFGPWGDRRELENDPCLLSIINATVCFLPKRRSEAAKILDRDYFCNS